MRVGAAATDEFNEPSRSRREAAAAVLAILGGALLLVGALLPWISATTIFGNFSRGGLANPDSVYVLAAGVVLAAGGVAALLRTAVRTAWWFVRIAVLFALFVGGVDGGQVAHVVHGIGNSDAASAAVGPGIVVIGLGALAGSVAGAMSLNQALRRRFGRWLTGALTALWIVCAMLAVGGAAVAGWQSDVPSSSSSENTDGNPGISDPAPSDSGAPPDLPATEQTPADTTGLPTFLMSDERGDATDAPDLQSQIAVASQGTGTGAMTATCPTWPAPEGSAIECDLQGNTGYHDIATVLSLDGEGGFVFDFSTLAQNPRTAGLRCADLGSRQLSYFQAVAYWFTQGRPARMDADGNGRPCETVYPAGDVQRLWGP